MKSINPVAEDLPASHSELLLLPDGRILVHNLTQTMADLLHELNPRENTIRARAEVKAASQPPAQLPHEFSN